MIILNYIFIEGTNANIFIDNGTALFSMTSGVIPSERYSDAECVSRVLMV